MSQSSLEGDRGGAIQSSATRLLKENAQHSLASAYRRRQVVGRAQRGSFAKTAETFSSGVASGPRKLKG